MSAKKKLIRERFRTETFLRDGHKCLFCVRTDQLDAHHIRSRESLPAGGYVASNGATLCPEHHIEAEEYYRTGQCKPEFEPAALYTRIGSSLEQAINDSERLERQTS